MADAANDLEEHGVVRTLKDLFAGAAGGIAQVLLGKSLSPRFFKSHPMALYQFLFFMSRVCRSGDVSQSTWWHLAISSIMLSIICTENYFVIKGHGLCNMQH
jgi:hypothetical protein